MSGSHLGNTNDHVRTSTINKSPFFKTNAFQGSHKIAGVHSGGRSPSIPPKYQTYKNDKVVNLLKISTFTMSTETSMINDQITLFLKKNF
jgi:hypothetical protein